MDYLITTNDTTAEQARRKIEANYLRHRCDWMVSKGYGKTFRDKATGNLIDPTGRSDDKLIDDYTPQMMGERAGALNDTSGFTESWAGPVQRRLTDNKIVIPLPDDADLRTVLIQGVPNPHSIDTESAEWWPTEEDEL